MVLATLFAALLASSCATRPADIPYDITAMELIQRGQEASDRNRFSLALQFYAEVLERFPFDTSSVIAAEYEIAFIHYKQRRYDMAKADFNHILERYNTPDEALLPPQFKILSQIVLARIDDIESGGRRRVIAW